MASTYEQLHHCLVAGKSKNPDILKLAERFSGHVKAMTERSFLASAEWRAPIIFNSPHSGSVYPKDFLAASRIDLVALRRSEDSFMDELIAGLSDQGFAVVRVNFPRSYVDVNREPYELDPRMYTGRLPSFANTRSMRVAGGLGTIPRVVGDGQEIYRERLAVEVRKHHRGRFVVAAQTDPGLLTTTRDVAGYGSSRTAPWSVPRSCSSVPTSRRRSRSIR